MNVIPAPLRTETGSGAFRFRSGTRVDDADATLAPIVERFCRDVSRRAGLQLDATIRAGDPAPDDAPSVRIEVTDNGDLAALPATIGVSQVADVMPDERYALTTGGNGVSIRAREPAGVARGLTTLLQLLASTPREPDGAVTVPAQRIFDVPQFAWRSFSLDVARRFFTVREVQRLIDLLALYKFNVLNMHFTDDQGWRLPFGRPANGQDPADPSDPFYSLADVRELARYAAERFVTLVPEVDAPGHASAITSVRPEPLSGRNAVDFEPVPGMQYHSVWFDPDLPATYDVLTGLPKVF